MPPRRPTRRSHEPDFIPGVDIPREPEKSFASMAPVHDAFPGFVEKDFLAFSKPKQRDELYNGERLLVKRKLAALGKELAAALAAAGLPVEAKTSLSHPYTFNGFKVESMWAYFGRDEAAKKAIKKKLGGELGKDVDPTYQGVILLVEINEAEVVCGLKIHPAAWWDGKNLAAKAVTAEAAKGAPGTTSQRALEWTRLMNALPAGFAMSIGDWKKRYEAGKVYDADIRNFFQWYKPGEVWLHLVRPRPRAQAIQEGAALAASLAADLVAAAPLFRFAAWAPDNDFVLPAKPA